MRDIALFDLTDELIFRSLFLCGSVRTLGSPRWGGFIFTACTLTIKEQENNKMVGIVPRVVHMQQVNGFVLAVLTRMYIERSLLMDGIVYVTQDTDLSSLPWLQDEGLAPEEVITVPNRCLFTGIENDAVLLSDLKSKLNSGARLQFFKPTNLEKKFINMLGLTWDQTLSCDPDIASKFANKAQLRHMGVSLGLSKAFLPHQLLSADWTPEMLEQAVREVGDEARKLGYHDVLVKRSDLANGDGMCLWSSGGRQTYVMKQRRRELIVEVAMQPHVPISNQWMIGKSGSTYIGVTRQIQDGFSHKGNIVASQDAMLDERCAERLRALTRPFVELARCEGYNGNLGFDAVWDAERNRLFLVEANARLTASTYPFAVGSRLRSNTWVVANKVIEPAKWFETFKNVRISLGSILYRGERQYGIVPYMLGGLTLDKGRCLGLMAIATDTVAAEHLLSDAEKRLTELHG